jgi:hypothetical protein
VSKFLSRLYVEYMENDKGCSLPNKQGRQLWMVMADFSYQSDVAGITITVPQGFVTDFASVPRIPFVYDSLGDIAQRPAVIHDYLYSVGPVARSVADQVLLEAMELTEIPWAKRKLIYLGVRVGGESHYMQK